MRLWTLSEGGDEFDSLLGDVFNDSDRFSNYKKLYFRAVINLNRSKNVNATNKDELAENVRVLLSREMEQNLEVEHAFVVSSEEIKIFFAGYSTLDAETCIYNKQRHINRVGYVLLHGAGGIEYFVTELLIDPGL